MVNKIALGTAQFGMPYGIANRDGQVHADEISSILDLAWQTGIDTIDTAKTYGNSERSIGNYIKYRPNNKWIIITKISNSENKVVDQIKNSMEKLTIRPCVVLAHSAELFLEQKFQNELEEARDKKEIAKAGVSLYCEDEINKVMESALRPEVIQLPLNILDTRLYRHGVLSRLHDAGLELHVRSAFLQGLFYLSEADLKAHFKDALSPIRKLKSIASDFGLTLAELSLLWIISLEEVSKTVIGIDNVDQLKAHLETQNKNVDPAVFEEALSVHYENASILNPSLWQ